MSGTISVIDTAQTGADGTSAGGANGASGGPVSSAVDSDGSFNNQDSASGGSTFIAIPGAGTIDLAGFAGSIPSGDVSFATACHAGGTRFDTPFGECAVEALQVACTRHPRAGDAWPVRVAAGARVLEVSVAMMAACLLAPRVARAA